MLGVAGTGAMSATFARRGGREDERDDLDQAAAPPDGVRQGMNRVVWSADTSEPVVALTFDDGPDPELTPRILDVLDRFEVPATFFVMGYNALAHPALVAEAAARGHEIGSHTWTHLDLVDQSPEEMRRQLTLGHTVVRSAIGKDPTHFRPPYGRLSGPAVRYAAEMDNDIILWSLGRGPGTGTASEVADHVVGNVRPGDIILLHDGIGRETFDTDIEGWGPVRRRREVEVHALPRVIERTLESGMRFATVSDLLGAPA